MIFMAKEKENLKKIVIKNSFWNFLANLMSRLGALIFTIIIARFLLPGGFGIYSLAISVALIFLTFADLGINQTMVRFVSSEITKNKKKAEAYFKYTLKLKISLSITLSFLLFILAYPLSEYVFKKPDLFYPLILLSFYVFLFSMLNFFSSLFYVKKKVHYILIKETIFQIARISLVLVSFFIFYAYIGGVIYSLIFSTILAIIFTLFYLKKEVLLLFKKLEEKIDKRRVMKFLGFLTIGSLSVAFFSYIDIIMLGIFLPAEFVGYYRAAFALVFGIAGMLSLTNILLPVFTQLKKERIENIFNKILKYSLILVVPASFGLAALSKYILRFIYGYNYLAASLPLFFLSFLLIPIAYIQISLTLFSAREKPKEFAKLTILIALLNIILNYILITSLLKISERWAIAGAAIATLISWIFYFVGCFIISKKKFQISINWKLLFKPLAASIIMFVALTIILRGIQDMGIFLGILLIIFGAAIYFIFLFLFKGINKEDLELIKLVKK